MRLDGKVAFISGAARGMGAAEARLFAREGASVVIGDILEDQGKAVEAQINEFGGQALFVRLDVTKEAEWQKAISTTVERFGRLDILVNNAGMTPRGRLEDNTVEEWDRYMDLNAKGTFFGTKTAIPEMRKAGGGSIVNISSTQGIIADTPYPKGKMVTSPIYHASKGAVRIFTKAAAIQYAGEGIRVNSVHPGPIETRDNQEVWADPEFREFVLSKVPLGRLGRAEDVANGVLYLASDESSFVTGSELVIDGGKTAQ